MMILYFWRNCLVINITTLKHVDHNVEDVCVDDEPTFLDKFFKDEYDHSFEKTYVEEIMARTSFRKQKLGLSIFTFHEPSNNQSFEN